MFKLQFLALDFLIAFSIFLIIFSLILINFLKIQEDLNKKIEFEFLKSSLETISSFFDFTGYPENWNCQNFEAIGFLKEKYSSEINLTKLEEINNCLEKILQKELIYGKFIIKTENYCFGFCNEIFENSEAILTTKRIRTINNSAIEFQIIIWK
ncbi:MAG: hypothetical protein QXQ14_03725 [Candidatus Aenigmatarchaeota archaeon]